MSDKQGEQMKVIDQWIWGVGIGILSVIFLAWSKLNYPMIITLIIFGIFWIILIRYKISLLKKKN